MRKIYHGEFYCLSTGIDTVASQITTTLNAFELCLSQFNNSFTKMEKRFLKLNNQLEQDNLSSCLQPTVNLLKKITNSISESLFLEKYNTIYQNYDEIKRKYEDEYAAIKPQAKKIRGSLKAAVSSLQKSVEPIKRIQDVASNSTLQNSIIAFYSRFESDSSAARELVTNFCTLSSNTIINIKEYVQQIFEPMMIKCSLDIPNEIDDSLALIESLNQQMKNELNVSNVIQQFVITTLPPVLKTQANPQQTHKMINYFELENILSNTGTARVIKDYTSTGKDPVTVKVGEVLDIVSTGYSKIWKVQNSKKVFFYVPSGILQL